MGNRSKKVIRITAVICSVVILLIVSSIMAYFSSVDETTNRFQAISLDIILTETKWDPEKAKQVIPGDELDKNPQVTNNDRADAYVFLRVTVPCDTQRVDKDNGEALGATNEFVPMYKFMTAKGTDPETYDVNTDFSPVQAVHSHWVLLKGTSADSYTSYDETKKQYIYVYGYSLDGTNLTVLKKDKTTEPLFDKLNIWNFSEVGFDENSSHSVLVEAFGIQSDLPGYSANDMSGIWELLEGGG